MLASKPVLVSAKRSDNGKFSKNNNNNGIHLLKKYFFYSRLLRLQMLIIFYHKIMCGCNLLTPPHNLNPLLSNYRTGVQYKDYVRTDVIKALHPDHKHLCVRTKRWERLSSR